MVPILAKNVPCHLQELALIDCKLSPTLIEDLMLHLTERSRIKKFSLVNA